MLEKCWVEYNLYYVISLALNVSTDILIMAIPMPVSIHCTAHFISNWTDLLGTAAPESQGAA